MSRYLGRVIAGAFPAPLSGCMRSVRTTCDSGPSNAGPDGVRMHSTDGGNRYLCCSLRLD